MNSGIGPIHWMAPEFFSSRYTEKADVFSLGTLLFAILERDFVMINGKPMYGAFKRIPGGGKVGIGYAMANYGSNITIQFSPYAQGSAALQRIAVDAMQYNKNDRPSAKEIHNRITNIQGSVLLGSAILGINKHQKDGAVDFVVRGFYWRLHRSVRQAVKLSTEY